MTVDDDQAAEAIRRQLLKNPKLLVELLRRSGVSVPEHTTAKVERVDWEELIPKDCQATGVLYFQRDGQVEFAAGIELQFTTDDDRARREWPATLAWLHAEYWGAGGLVIIAPDPEVARWSAEPIKGGSLHMQPLVLGPDHLDLLPDEARRSLDAIAATSTEPRNFNPDDVAEFLRSTIGDDDANGVHEFLNSVGYDLPDGLSASFTVKGRGPLRTFAV